MSGNDDVLVKLRMCNTYGRFLPAAPAPLIGDTPMPDTGWDHLDSEVLRTFRAAASQSFLDSARGLSYQMPHTALHNSLKVLVRDGYLTHQPGSEDMPERWNLTSAGLDRLNETATRWAAA